MNEDHIIAAILAAGLIAQDKSVDLKPKDAVSVYGECLTELIESTRPQRPAPSAVAE